MQLTIFNGSPRGKKSNSSIIIEHFIKGCEEAGKVDYKVHIVKQLKKAEDLHKIYKTSEVVLVVFPLYVDSMPAMMKEFFEWLEPFVGKKGLPKLGFIIHSGFGEAIHSFFLRDYLDKIGPEISSEYLGTMIKPSTEGMAIQTSGMVKKKMRTIRDLAAAFIQSGKFDPVIMEKSAKPIKYNAFAKVIIRLIKGLGFLDFYWNYLLKKNGAKDMHDARPYA
ncbi:MAG: NAD(P)H-dependent oxidoreductase [Acidobacteria bacterium]|nr:NAD(P)H-dependent oxidoreductase [Acidobacteriota bacterium]